MVKTRFEWIEIFLVVFGILGLSSSLFNPPPPESNFVPSAVTAFASMSGILTAFIGFWLTHAYSNARGEAAKKWISKRIKVIVFLVGSGLLVIIGSINDLVFGRLERAYETALLGTSLIVLVLTEIILIIAFSEKEFES